MIREELIINLADISNYDNTRKLIIFVEVLRVRLVGTRLQQLEINKFRLNLQMSSKKEAILDLVKIRYKRRSRSVNTCILFYEFGLII